MSSAISGYISQIQNAVYGEQVRGAIVSALEACYSDVENPNLQSAAFQTAIEAAYQGGILDIIEVTQVSQMTNENIVYRYMGTQTGYTANTLYYHNGTAWVPIGSGLRTASTAATMTDHDAIYKYTGSESGYITNGLYYWNGTEFAPIYPGTDSTLTSETLPANAKAVGDKVEFLQKLAGKYAPLPAEWVRGTLQNGVIYSGNNGVVSNNILYTAFPIEMEPTEYIKFGIHYLTKDGTFISDTGWININQYIIPANSYFRVIIRDFREVQIATDEVEKYAARLRCKSGWYTFINSMKYPVLNMFKEAAYISANAAAAFNTLVESLFDAGSLPSGYTEHDYLESNTANSNTLIDIGFPDSTINIKGLRFEVDFQLSNSATSESCPFSLLGTANTDRQLGVYLDPTKTTKMAIHYAGYDSGYNISIDSVFNRHKVAFEDGKVYVDDQLALVSSGSLDTTYTPLLMFCRSQIASNLYSTSKPFLGKIFGFNISIAGAYFVNLVPAEDSDENPGFYDYARGKFFKPYNSTYFSVGDSE